MKFINEMLTILKYSTLGPGTTVEMCVFLVLAAALASFAVIKTAAAFSFSMADMKRALLVIVVTSFAGLAAAAALKLYAVPKMSPGTGATVLMIGTQIIILLVVGGLMCKFVMKGPYVQGVVSLVVGFAAGMALLFLANAASDAIRHGSKEFEKTKKRTEEVNKQL